MDSGTRLRISLKGVYKIIFKKCEIARKLNWSRIEYTLLSRNIWITYSIFKLYLSNVVVPSLFYYCYLLHFCKSAMQLWHWNGISLCTTCTFHQIFTDYSYSKSKTFEPAPRLIYWVNCGSEIQNTLPILLVSGLQ